MAVRKRKRSTSITPPPTTTNTNIVTPEPASSRNKQQPNQSKKQTNNTVFFRYNPPPSVHIPRSDFETFFSEAGIVKKCDIIRDKRTARSPETATTDREEPPPPPQLRQAKGYGFCKFASHEDALTAVKLNETYLTPSAGGVRLKVNVELYQADGSSSTTSTNANSTPSQHPPADSTPIDPAKKRKSRVIIRNLSFYATQNNVYQTMTERFGPVLEVNLPLVPNTPNTSPAKKLKRPPHRGFAFVTFNDPNHAKNAVRSCSGEEGVEGVVIKGRPVAIDFSVAKVQHVKSVKEQRERERLEQEKGEEENEEEEEENEKEEEEEEEEEEEKEDGSESSNHSSSESESESETESESESESKSDSTTKPKPNNHHDSPQHTLFLRDLPFDATRHDLFQAFYRFGHIEGVYLVAAASSPHDNDDDDATTTKMHRGTAFIRFRNALSCERALKCANGSSSTGSTIGEVGKIGSEPTTDSPNNDDDDDDHNDDSAMVGRGIYIGGRRILVDRAVDRTTAESLRIERDEDGKTVEGKGKDRRNLYLANEGRVEHNTSSSSNKDNQAPTVGMDPDAWENLPESDQQKRGRAHKDRHTKLRSPLFLINPCRLSVRNLARGVTEADLKLLAVMGVERGLEKGLVDREDVKAHWKAGGEMTTRDIVRRIAELEREVGGDKEEKGEGAGLDDPVIPAFDKSQGIKKWIPSVYIDRDYGGASAASMRAVSRTDDNDDGTNADHPTAAPSLRGGSKVVPPSRGFGFVEFREHAHALACLRELNNNRTYSAKFVAGGKAATTTTAKRGGKKKGKRRLLEDDGTATAPVGVDGKMKIPRLIVEFTVENGVKAKKRAEKKALQVANAKEQRRTARESHRLSNVEEEEKEDDDNDKGGTKKKMKPKKKSRGALQRERKRKRKEREADEGEGDAAPPSKSEKPTAQDGGRSHGNSLNEGGQTRSSETNENNQHSTMMMPLAPSTEKGKKAKKAKKRLRVCREDEEDEAAFENMVRSYKKSFGGGADGMDDAVGKKESNAEGGATDVKKKRWFD